MHTQQFFNPLLLRKSQRYKGLRGYRRIGYDRFITYPREVRINVFINAVLVYGLYYVNSQESVNRV